MGSQDHLDVYHLADLCGAHSLSAFGRLARTSGSLHGHTGIHFRPVHFYRNKISGQCSSLHSTVMASMNLVLVGVSHKTAPVEIREQLCFPKPKLGKALQELKSRYDHEEGMILSTCNR